MKAVFDKKKIFRERTEARVVEVGAGIAHLKAAMKRYRAEKKQWVNKIVEDLDRQYREIKAVVGDMKKKGTPSWDEFGSELSSMTEQLSEKIREARSAVNH